MKTLFAYILLIGNLIGTSSLNAQNNEDLVEINGCVVICDEEVFELEVRIDIAEGWYLFVSTPEDIPLQSVQLFCELPLGYTKFGEAEQIYASTEQYGKDLIGVQYGIIFKQKFVRYTSYEHQIISCSVVCQACNRNYYTESYMKEITIKL